VFVCFLFFKQSDLLIYRNHYSGNDVLHGHFHGAVEMFVFVSIIFVFVAYTVFIKFVYYRFSQLWPQLRNKISTPSYTFGDAHFCPTQKRSGAFLPNSETANETRALLVTAHPDDECMFFAPSILKLVESQASVYLLCLSTGRFTIT